MANGPLLSDDLMLTDDAPRESSHPMDSSRMLVGLISLSRRAESLNREAADAGAVDRVICKGVLRSLLSALQFRDMATVRHSRRVAMLATGMAQFLGWEEHQLKVLEVASLLHDIGKIGVPDSILFKPGKLSPDEAELMALHRYIGIDVLQAARVEKEVLEIVEQSLNYYSGMTERFPQIGKKVHQGARILSVADAYDSLSNEQVYRESKSHEDIMDLLMDSSTSHFDGNIVSALSRWIETEGLPFQGEDDEGAMNSSAQIASQSSEALEAGSLCHIFSYLYLLESLYDGFCVMDSDFRFVVWNHGLKQLTDRPSHEMLNQRWTNRLLPFADRKGRFLGDTDSPMQQAVAMGKPATTQARVQRANGAWVEVEVQSVPLLDQNGILQGVAQIFRDLTHNGDGRHERELKLEASRDSLTSVANRRELESQLGMLLSDFLENPDVEPFSLIFLDIDCFKSINDSFGHRVGDQVLVEVAQLLQKETYSGELVSRYGGEEFVILCPDTNLQQAVKRAERLRIALSRAELGELSDFEITASFGVTEAEIGDTFENLLQRADQALYGAKKSGRNQTCSLTSQQLTVSSDSSSDGKKTSFVPQVFESSFQAYTAANMVIYKLGGFVDDNRAKLVNVESNRATIQLGKRNFLLFWGGSDEKRPVTLEVEFGEQHAPQLKRRSLPTQRVHVKVTVRPLGWVRNPQIFEQRARKVLKLLRSYFVAD